MGPGKRPGGSLRLLSAELVVLQDLGPQMLLAPEGVPAGVPRAPWRLWPAGPEAASAPSAGPRRGSFLPLFTRRERAPPGNFFPLSWSWRCSQRTDGAAAPAAEGEGPPRPTSLAPSGDLRLGRAGATLLHPDRLLGRSDWLRELSSPGGRGRSHFCILWCVWPSTPKLGLCFAKVSSEKMSVS